MDGKGFRSPGDAHVDSFTAKAQGHVPEGAFVVPDPNLIFNGEFKRTGLDLVLSHEGHEFVVHDYFRGDKRAALASPDGAHLTGEIVSALTGHVQVAQAAPGAGAGQVIGHVTKLVGSATAIRNGVSVILNNGDNVEKGDVVSTGADSTLGITFIDGTVFGLSSNARMVLNEMVYDPNGSSNSSLLSLVAGTITFVAGETAKHGDMKIDTPVATMGIRGTAVLTQINFVVPAGGGDPQPQASFQVLVEPNGTTGSYILFDKVTLLPIATVNQAGQMIQISGGNVSITNALMSPDVQKLITDVFTLKFSDNNTNTKLTTNFTDTLTPMSLDVVFKSSSGPIAIATFVNLNPQGQEGPSTPTPPIVRIPGQPIAQSFDASGIVKTAFALTERAGATGATDADTISGLIRFVDQNLGDRPTVSISLAEAPNYVYKDAGQHDVTGSLSALQKQSIAATQIQISVVSDPGNNNNGSAVWTYTIPDKVFDFLAAGETVTLTYMVRVDTNFAVSPESAFIPITITITGTNDKPVITTDVPIITFEGGTSVPGGPLTSEVPTSGTLNFNDVDLTDKHTVSVALTSATLPDGSVPPGPLAAFQSAMSVAIAAGADSTGDGTGTINWSLADLPVYLADFIPQGAVLTLVYTVTLTDSQGGSSQQTITVTITGTDAPAVVWIATEEPGAPSGGLWQDAGNWATGTVPTDQDDVIVITDQLHGLTPSYPVTIDVAAFAKSLTLDDYDTTPGHKVPEVINNSTLTIGGKLTLNADAKFTNSLGGHVTVGGAIDVETITRTSGVVVTNTSTITNAGTLTLQAGGTIDTLTAVANSGLIDLTGGTLVLKSDVANAGGTIQTDAGATLIVDGATVDGGTLVILGTLESTGISAIDDADITIASTGMLSVTSGTLTIDPATIHAVTNHGLIEAVTGGTLKLTAAIIGNTGGTISVDDASTLYLAGVSINGGSLSNAGNLYSVSGSNTITGAVTNTGTIEVQAGTLNLSGGVTGVGTLIVDDGATLALGGADAQTVTFAGGLNTLQLDATSHDFTGTITVEASTGGTLTVTGDADINSLQGDALDVTASGGTSGNRANIVLNPTGALTGAANGLVVTQNGFGDITLTATGDITGLAGHGIWLSDGTTGSGDITVNNVTGKATGNGANSVGVLVENSNAANDGDISVTQLGGAGGGAYGIDAVTQGDGDITIDAGGAITGSSVYGIRSRSYGSGNQTVTTEAGSLITSGSSGIVAVNRAALLDAAAGSTITVNAHGTINSGSSPNLAGNAPAGIEAGYTGATNGTSANTLVNATVIVNNYADITAAAGLGINAYNYGNGGVTVNSFAGTAISVSGAQSIGINAAALSGGAGDVTVTLGEDVTISGATSYGIRAFSLDAGDITVTLADGDNITSSSSGIVAVNYAVAIAAAVGSTISVEAHGAIHSGSTLNNDGTTPGGIIAGYKPGGTGAFSSAVNGDVIVTSDATITADAGYGIEAFTWGAGNVTVTTGENSDIDAAGIAIGAFDHGGGDVSVTNNGSATGSVGVAALATGGGDVTIVNHGDITSTSLAGISVTQNAVDATGSTHITNSGSIAAATGHAAIYIQGNATGTVTIDNSGTIGPDDAGAVTSTTYAIVETGGSVTINNSGDINGNISVATATFNNQAGGIWTVSGTSVFGNASSIVNAGDIDLLNGAWITGSGLSIVNSHEIDSWGTAKISGAITNTGTIEVNDGTLTLFGSLSGTGSVTVHDGALLKLEGTVTQTITLAGDGAALRIDTATFGGSIAQLSADDTIDLSTIKYGVGTSAVYVANADPSTGGVLTVTDADGNHISLNLTGADYSNGHFAGSSDGHGGTLITFNANDDAPNFAAAEASPTVSFSELADTTGSAALDPVSGGTGTIHFTDIDLTDRPTATISGQATTWLDADHTTQLTLTAGQESALEQALTIQQAGNKNNGAIAWSYSIADSALDFLGEGQTATVVSTITLDDHKGGTDTAEVTVTITGTNDAPAISYATSDHMDFDGRTIAVGEVPTVASDGVTLDGRLNWNGGAAPGGQVLFYNGNTSTAGFGLIGTVVSGHLEIEILEGGVDILDTGFALPAGEWHNLALTRHQGTYTLYVDGNAVYSHSGSANAVGSGQDPSYMMIGAASDRYAPGFGEQGFTGSIADVSVWTTALTQQQIQSIDFTALTGNEANLAAYYQFGGSSGTTVANKVNAGQSLGIDLADLMETNAGLQTHGVLTLSDVDSTDHVTVSVSEVQVIFEGVNQPGTVGGLSHETLLGYLSVPGDIMNGTASGAPFTWQFNSGSQTFDFLAAGQTLSLQYTIVPSDGHAATGTGNGDVTVTIVGSNDAPTLNNSTLGAISEDATAPAGSSVGALFAAGFHDADAGASFKAVAVTASHATAAEGVWQYQVAGSNQWTDIAGVSDSSALLLATDTLIRFVPAANFSGAPGSLDVHALDDTYGGNVTTPVLIDITSPSIGSSVSAAATLSTEVTPVADAPAFNIDHTPIADVGEFLVNTTTANDQTYSAIGALSDGGYVIAWVSQGQDGDGAGIYAQHYASSGAKIGGEFRVNTATAGNQSSPYVVGLEGGGFVVSWTSGSDNGATIHLQRFDSSGSPAGGEVSLAGYGENATLAALSNGGFVITYVTSDASASGTYGIVYDSSGVPTSGPFLINTETVSQQQGDSVAGTADGGFVASWHSYGQDEGSGSWGVYFQRFDAQGNKLGGEVQVNTNTVGDQYGGELAVLKDGSIVVSYTDANTLVLRHFSSTGAPIGNEVSISDATTATLQALPDGGFLVTYQGHDAPGSLGLLGQRFDASLHSVGSSFVINETTNGDQLFLADRSNPTAVTSDGKIVSTWFSPGDGGNDVEARVFAVPGFGSNSPIKLPAITAAAVDSDGSETLLIKLSGYPAGATFSVGHAGTGADAGQWLIGAAEIASLAASGLTMTAPAGYHGEFNLHVGVTVIDSANGLGGPLTDTYTITEDVVVKAGGGPVIDTSGFQVEHIIENSNDIITDLVVIDTDSGAAADTFTVTLSTAHPDVSSVDVYPVSGSLAQINTGLASGAGIAYDPVGASADEFPVPPATDQITLTVADSAGHYDTVNFIFVEGADSQGITLQGTSGKDVIFATESSDTLIGGGAKDQFVFAPTSSQDPIQHAVSDFETGLDKIDLRQFTNITSWTQVSALTEQQGDDTLLTLDANDKILLKNVVAGNLHASDFILHVS
ncbi:LamG-like jellyroll fold domain-containing protein [Bradyrhizobium sp. A11]|uniref:LamG-like jellyroll fold domain-containing protein n=1 Tax=Bradyrhizobium sp. A11 TaxID=3133974 RepID=UPI00324A84AA